MKEVVKDKLRHSYIFLEFYLNKNQFKSGSTKLEMVRSTSPMGAREKTFKNRAKADSKQGNFLIGCN